MGTRNLTIVVHKNETKIAQYGQWDGYPSSNGVKILKFLRKVNIEKFKDNLKRVHWMTPTEEKALEALADNNGEWKDYFPQISRDVGTDILLMVDGRKLALRNQEEFASESLQNEWSYVLDLDKEQLEVYTGFQTKPVPKTERFAKYNEKAERESMEFVDYKKDGTPKEKKHKYYPIKLVKIYKFDNLPNDKQFISECEPEEK